MTSVVSFNLIEKCTKVLAGRWPVNRIISHWPSRQQRRLEGAGNRRPALAGLQGITDHHDPLSRPGDAAGRRAGASPRLVVEPVAERVRGENPAQDRPPAGALVEQQVRQASEAEAVACAGRDHDAVVGCERLRRLDNIDAIKENDALVHARRHHAFDITVERSLVRRNLLKQRRLAGAAKRAARRGFALEHRHAIGVGDERRIGEPGGPRADDGDALALRWLCRREAGFVAGGFIYAAAPRRPPPPLLY